VLTFSGLNFICAKPPLPPPLPPSSLASADAGVARSTPSSCDETHTTDPSSALMRATVPDAFCISVAIARAEDLSNQIINENRPIDIRTMPI